MRRPPGIGGRSEAGFTLVELLIVFLIVSLLSAVAIPAFMTQRDKARDAEAKVQVKTAYTAMQIYATDHDNSYGGADEADLRELEPTLSQLSDQELRVQVMGNSGRYRLSVTAPSGNVFSIRREADESLTYACSSAGTGGCPSTGLWDG